MGAAELTTAQRERVSQGRCAAPGCDAPHLPGSSYCAAGRAGQACRARASRERRGAPDRMTPDQRQAARQLSQVQGQLAELTARIDELQRERDRLRRVATDLQARASGQVQIPGVEAGRGRRRIEPRMAREGDGGALDLVAQAVRAKIEARGEHRVEDPAEALWRLCTEEDVQLLETSAPSGHRELYKGPRFVGLLAPDAVERLILAGLLRLDGEPGDHRARLRPTPNARVLSKAAAVTFRARVAQALA